MALPPVSTIGRFNLRNAVAPLKSFEIQGRTRDLSEWKESPNG
jgi:hypothetical protein